MSGFASELAVFLGVASSDIYSSTFRTVTVFLSAVGLILTPIYLLSMLRQLFYGTGRIPACVVGDTELRKDYQDNQETVCFGTNCVLPAEADYSDARPREVFIAACFLALIVGIGFYPKLATQLYDVKTVALNAQVRQSYTQISQANPQVYARGFLSPKITSSEVSS
jgi:NAD(P)H-quinone oxidoreductase subunit 4